MNRQCDAREAIARLEAERENLREKFVSLVECRHVAAPRAAFTRQASDQAARELGERMRTHGLNHMDQRQKYADALAAKVDAQSDYDRIVRETNDVLKRIDAIEGEIISWRRHLPGAVQGDVTILQKQG